MEMLIQIGEAHTESDEDDIFNVRRDIQYNLFVVSLNVKKTIKSLREDTLFNVFILVNLRQIYSKVGAFLLLEYLQINYQRVETG